MECKHCFGVNGSLWFYRKIDAVAVEKTDLMTHVQTCLSTYRKLLIKKGE